MPKPSKLLISTGAALAVAATATLPSGDPISLCFDSQAVVSLCHVMPPEMADGPHSEPEPLPAQRTFSATASSTAAVQLTARSFAKITMRGVLTLG